MAAAPGKPAGGGGGAACAACKYQRRRCTAECPLAQYFPHDQPRVFRNAHRLFGVSNILKTLARAGPERRRDAMRAIIFESHAWDVYPAHGCVPVILALQQQLLHAQRQLHLLNARIHAYRAALGPLPPDADADGDGDGDPSSPAPPPPGATDHLASSSFYDEQQQQLMMTMDAAACAYDTNNGVAAAAAASVQAPWMMPPQYDIATTSNVVVDMAGVVPQLQHHQPDHQFLVDGTTMMMPHSSSSSQQQQQQLYCNSVSIPPEPYDDEMSSYLVDNINEEMPPHESSTDSSERKAVKAPKMELSANGPKDAAGGFVGTSSTRFT
ncbi:hypothetical protein ACP70R_023841 [Stipagrostis hirtigluma subsp. patula]